MRLASTFPAVSVLGAAQGGPTFETAQIERAFRTECSLLEAQRSPYWGIIDQLCDNSPKIRFLDEMLQEMKADRSPFRGYDYGVEDQQIFRKKAVVYAEKPVTAHLLVLHLWKKFPELNPTIITAGQSRAVKDSRAVWFQRMPGSTREETASDPRVLVTTYGLSGVGLNLIRANYMLLVEPAWMKTRQVQAAGRCDREGQKAERTHIWLVYCKRETRLTCLCY